VDAKVPVFSFIFGIPPKEFWMSAGRSIASSTIGTATTPEEGAALQEAGVDAIAHRLRSRRASRFIPSGPQRIHSRARFRWSRKLSTGSMCQCRCGRHSRCTGVVATLALGAEAVQSARHSWLARNPVPASSSRSFARQESRTHCVDQGFTGRLAREFTIA